MYFLTYIYMSVFCVSSGCCSIYIFRYLWSISHLDTQWMLFLIPWWWTPRLPQSLAVVNSLKHVLLQVSVETCVVDTQGRACGARSVSLGTLRWLPRCALTVHSCTSGACGFLFPRIFSSTWCYLAFVFRFHIQVMSYSICLFLSDLFHLA